MTSIQSLEFKDGKLYLIDQRKLPEKLSMFECKEYKDVEFAIKDMIVRGAPAIGVAGAYGIVLAAKKFLDLPKEKFLEKIKESAAIVGNARPTAVNLMWAVRRMMNVLEVNRDRANSEIYEILLDEAKNIEKEDLETNKAIARYGNEIVPEGATILTHCNAGALATTGYGTALGVIREAHYMGKNIRVFADETRPRLQGAKLTAWELVQEKIPAKLIPDSVAAVLIRDGKIDVIIVGADRIALNGDTANKIGTFMLSQMAKDFKVPFYIAAPISTIDFDIKSGKEIVIEERAATEVTHINGVRIAPEGIDVYNPAFDVTPNENITGIITEKGIMRPPYLENLSKLKERH
ncbi:Methylthioribose-1-phosphate isomerase [Tepidanaerobacter acetatoxydans Re1]|uniref:Methylthioribose-1-phosphate isomerase n=1 Tax=Tepidanaerobacter acetatoxydans (strain DSM 21804 / JCM 16047 / Re1) TaxID=1209989 RepID=F4LUM6_TEPAE|nr:MULTISPECIES: S-methyl-5-thioribose-1-phosphate isomerase [Tepidanaerobacter]AEE90594.1 Methylthioribose-1-phosphate isomerase [Tepidanaerobacter acetatoxydans Re1]CCP25113.1 Methylthioribose-1-phosphate isomerase [Tepidanaerobacter acetatoxydans Re1]